MPRLVLAQLRRRSGRAVAVLLGILVAATGFTVLTGTTETSRLQVVGEVEANFRAAYDILVRPPAERTPLEEERGLVRPNFLSGQFGGISLDQYERIRQLPGVAVAAPIAMIGYVTADGFVELDLTDAVDRSLTRQIIRVQPTWRAARGLTVLDNDVPRYVYVTKRPILWPVYEDLSGDWDYGFTDGRTRPELARECDDTVFPLEIQEDGRELPLCQLAAIGVSGPLGGEQEARSTLLVAQLRPDGRFSVDPPGFNAGSAADRLTLSIHWPLSLLLAAIDPDAEAALVGLDSAVTSGRYLDPGDRPVDHEQYPQTSVPVLATTTPFLDEQLTTAVSRVTGTDVELIAGLSWAAAREILHSAGGVPAGSGGQYTAADAYGALLEQKLGEGLHFGRLFPVVQTSDPRYAAGVDGSLTPAPVTADPAVFVDERAPGLPTSWLLADGGFRELTQLPPPTANFLDAHAVGTFDPAKLHGFSELSAVPMETYFPPRAEGADAQSRGLLGDRPLQPDSNPGGYLATPPLMLTALGAFPGLTEAPAPLSAIRVRVAGVTGFDDLSRERVRIVAEAIAGTTGLDVDITMGSSPAPQTVNLPAGLFGRPELRLNEEWTKKGVAAAIIQAVDHKSLVLFGLILLVCVLFVGNAVSAAVRDRRRELAVLACLGWSRARLGALIAAETALVGLIAGTAGAALALPLARLVGVRLTIAHALLAIPVAVGLALAAAMVPVLRAARTHPARAVSTAARAPRRGRARRRRTIAGLALANLWRVPGRTLLAASALAIGIGAATALAAITWAFHGSVTGTLLGDAVSLRARGVDAVAVAATVLLGVVAVADVLYLNVRDRSAEFAALTATGWSAGALGRLVTYEAVGIAAIGSAVGAAAGAVSAVRFAGEVPVVLGWLSLAVIVGGVLLTAAAALVPTLLQRRLPLATLLSEE